MQGILFQEPVTPEIFEQIPNASPAFLTWVRMVHDLGCSNEIARVVIDAGEASSVLEAFTYLSEVSKGVRLGSVTLEDLTGKTFQGIKRSIQAFKRKRDIAAPRATMLDYRFYGGEAHRALQALACGYAPLSERTNQLSLALDLESNASSQLSLWDQAPAELPQIPDGIQALRTLSGKMARELQSGPWYEQYRAVQGKIDTLRSLLYPFCGSRVQLTGSRDSYARYLETHTLLTMAWGVRQYAQKTIPHALVEVPIADPRTRLSFGRVDLFFLHRINGKPLTAKQRQIATRLSRLKYPSVGAYVAHMARTFRSPLEFFVGDYKCMVGDGGSRGMILPRTVTQQPRVRDVRQVSRYVACILADAFWCLRGYLSADDLDQVVIRGLVDYRFSDRRPITHPVILDLTECRETLQRMLAEPWQSATEHMVVRQTSQYLLSHVATLAKMKKRCSMQSDLSYGSDMECREVPQIPEFVAVL